MLEEITRWLVGRVPGLTLGTNVFMGWRPDDAPDECHVFIGNGGPVIFDLPDRVDYMLQIVTRGEPGDYKTVYDNAWTIYAALHGTAGWQIPALVSGGQAYEAQTIEAMAAPQLVDQDERGCFEFSTNFICRMKKSP